MFAIQDTTKQLGDNLMDYWAQNFDCSPDDCMTFDTRDEAQEYMERLNYQYFALVVDLTKDDNY